MVFEDCVPPSSATSKLNQTKCVRELIVSFSLVFVKKVLLRSVRETYDSYKKKESSLFLRKLLFGVGRAM